MRRRERLFWLCVGAALIVLVFSLVPSHYEICEVAEKTKEENCPAHRVLPFLIIKIGKALDDHGNAVTAIFTVVLAISTIGLWAATRRLWIAGERQFRHARASALAQSRDMQASIKAAVAANQVAENALIATDRAWISIAAEAIGPLTFDEEVVSLNVEFTMTNVGKSPATNVELFAMLCPDIIAARNTGEATTELIHAKFLDFGIALFPEGTNSRKLIIGMKISAFKENIAESAKVVTEHGSPSDVPRETANPAIMACASYRLAGSRKWHHTIILFEVWHTDAGHLGWDGSTNETGVAFLKLVQNFLSGKVT